MFFGIIFAFVVRLLRNHCCCLPKCCRSEFYAVVTCCCRSVVNLRLFLLIICSLLRFLLFSRKTNTQLVLHTKTTLLTSNMTILPFFLLWFLLTPSTAMFRGLKGATGKKLDQPCKLMQALNLSSDNTSRVMHHGLKGATRKKLCRPELSPSPKAMRQQAEPQE